MKLLLARALPLVLALVVTALPSLARAEGSPKAHATHAKTHAKAHAAKRANAGPKAGAKPRKAAKSKAPVKAAAHKSVKAPRASKKTAK